MVLVQLAEPGINMARAIAAALLFHLVAYLPSEAAQSVPQNLHNALLINVALLLAARALRHDHNRRRHQTRRVG
jgi:hypothetical protein